jgi:hypothetical protein
MNQAITLTDITIPADGTAPFLPQGVKVLVKDSGVTGTTASEPFLMASGWAVDVTYAPEHAHLTPTGGATHGAQDVAIVGVDSVPAPAHLGLRGSLGAASAIGWELLYDKPRQGCEVGRRVREGRLQYALICKAHGHAQVLRKLADERQLRREGAWCPTCK